MLRRAVVAQRTAAAVPCRYGNGVYQMPVGVFRAAYATEAAAAGNNAKEQKYEKDEFEADISPDLIKKFEDVQVTPQLRSKVLPAPAHLTGKAGVLAMRLFENASAFGQLDSVGTDLNKLHRLAMKNEDFDNFLRDKAYQKSTQHQVFASVLGKSPRVLQRFLALNVVEEGNVARLLKVVDNFNELLSVHRKEVDVNITVASPLSTSALDKIKAQVVANLPAGSNPSWKINVKPEIGGGVIIDAGEFYSVDESRASQEAELSRRIDLILGKVRARLVTDVPEDAMPKTSPADLDASVKRSALLSTPEEVEKRRAKFAAADRAQRETQQAAFKRNFVDWA